MASVPRDAVIVERTLCGLASEYPSTESIRTIPVFDREHGRFLLGDEGWEGYRRVHNTWAHVEIAEGKLRIHEDGTEVGIANLLVGAGIPPDRIVLTFHAPSQRAATGFAAA